MGSAEMNEFKRMSVLEFMNRTDWEIFDDVVIVGIMKDEYLLEHYDGTDIYVASNTDYEMGRQLLAEGLEFMEVIVHDEA
jgi:hypothetical protein